MKSSGVLRISLVPAMETFKPDLTLISAGFDSRISDPLGDFTLTDNDFADLTTLMMKLADKHCHGRLISFLEGGYNLRGLAKAAAAHVAMLSGHFLRNSSPVGRPLNVGRARYGIILSWKLY